MQGRLSPMVNGKIQSFPWDNWKQEVGLAKSIGLSTMEWTLDQDRLYDNLLWSTKFGHKLRGCSQTLPLPWWALAHH